MSTSSYEEILYTSFSKTICASFSASSLVVVYSNVRTMGGLSPHEEKRKVLRKIKERQANLTEVLPSDALIYVTQRFFTCRSGAIINGGVEKIVIIVIKSN